MFTTIKQYSLTIVLCLLFLVSWIGQAGFQWQVYVNHQKQEQQPIEINDFMSEFASSTLENWQSEFLQLFSFVLLSTFLIHKGSPQSKDGDEKMQMSLDRIEKKLNTLSKRR